MSLHWISAPVRPTDIAVEEVRKLGLRFHPLGVSPYSNLVNLYVQLLTF